MASGHHSDESDADSDGGEAERPGILTLVDALGYFGCECGEGGQRTAEADSQAKPD